MRDSIGGVFNLTFIAIFMLVVSGYLAFSVSYNKAYKVKNKIISTLEQYEGYNSKSKEIIESYMDKLGYNAGEVASNLKSDYNCCSNRGYCVQWVSDDSADSGLPRGYYKVLTTVNIDVPIFNKFLPFMTFFKTTGDTMTIYATDPTASGSCG